MNSMIITGLLDRGTSFIFSAFMLYVLLRTWLAIWHTFHGTQTGKRVSMAMRSGYVVIVVACTLTVLTQVVVPIVNDRHEEEFTSKVVWKERVSYGNIIQDHKYLIYTIKDDKKVAVLENTDAFLSWKFNSSDVYALIEIGQTYKFRVAGHRIPIFSLYPNLITFEPVIFENKGNSVAN